MLCGGNKISPHLHIDMMSVMNAILTTAVFWSLTQGISFPSSLSTIETSVPLKRVARDIESINDRLPDNVVPHSYRIKLVPDLDGENFTFKGQSEISVIVRKPTKEITLHAKYLNIDDSIQLKCYFGGNSSEISTYNASNKSVDDEADFLTIVFEEQLLKDSNCILTLSWSSTTESSHPREGFFESTYLENGTIKRMVSTHFEPYYARRAFPCWDEPAFKATFSISIEHNKKYVALSNMHVVRNEEDPQDPTRTYTHFAPSPIMSTYLVVVAVGDFATVVENDSGNFRVWARKAVTHEGKHLQEIGPKILNMLENYLNSTYEAYGLKKMEIIAVPTLERGDAMESWGLITWKESCLTMRYYNPSEADELRVANAAHELAHQWLGNVVTPAWWDYVWLSESFAAYFQMIIPDQFEPKWRVRDRFVTESLQSIAFEEDSKRSIHAMSQHLMGRFESLTVFDMITYVKGACVIRMISNAIGEEEFQTRLRRYVETYAFKSVTPEDLFTVLANGNQDLYNAMSNWVNTPGYPVITVTRDYGTEQATITQSRFVMDFNQTSSERYHIPLNYAIEGKLDFNDTKFTHYFDPYWNVIQIEGLNKDQFVIFNKQQFGYYRVNYDEKNWRMIAEYLKTKNHNDIHVTNRAQLIDDAFHLAKLNQLRFDVALSLIGYLKKEKDFVAWKAVWRTVEKTFPYVKDSDYAEHYKQYILHLSEEHVQQLLSVDTNENDYFIKMYRDEFLHWPCTLGSELCITVASKEVNKWLDNYVKNPYVQLTYLTTNHNKICTNIQIILATTTTTHLNKRT